MARIGVFGLNLSPRSGGVFSLIEGLMAHAALSRHTFLYVPPARTPPRPPLPSNVDLLERADLRRIAMQGLLKVPGLHATLFRHGATSAAVLAGVCGIHPRVFADVDLWLWPHCFVPVPRLARTVVICHDLIHRHHPEHFGALSRLIRRQAERSLRHCAAIVCPSRTTADDLIDAYPALSERVRVFAEAPCEVLPESAHADESRQLEERFGSLPLLLFVAVDWPHKNHALLIDAALRLRARLGRGFRIVFAGHRRTAGALAGAIRRAGADDLVVDMGAVTRPMLAALFRRASALLFPSLCEGFGIPLVEAMQYGSPILASDRSCLPEVCGDAAVLLPPTSPERWAEEIERILAQAAHRGALAARSRERGMAFNWGRTWSELDEIFAAAAVPAAAPAPVGPTPTISDTVTLDAAADGNSPVQVPVA